LKNILLLEDDTLLGETLQELLELNGYSVDLVVDGAEASELSYENSYQLYIFDINVPEIDGLALLESLRAADDTTPTIFISALIDLQTMTRGFKLGADDYIKKPFFPEELLIRVDSKMSKYVQIIECEHFSYNPTKQEIDKDGKIILLSKMLKDMLHLFILSKPNVITRDELFECMENPSSNALRVAITKLKQETGLDIKNIRGIGYKIESC